MITENDLQITKLIESIFENNKKKSKELEKEEELMLTIPMKDFDIKIYLSDIMTMCLNKNEIILNRPSDEELDKYICLTGEDIVGNKMCLTLYNKLIIKIGEDEILIEDPLIIKKYIKQIMQNINSKKILSNPELIQQNKEYDIITDADLFNNIYVIEEQNPFNKKEDVLKVIELHEKE